MPSAETEAHVEPRRQRGGFTSADEVVRAAFTLLDRQGGLAALSSVELDRAYPDLRAQVAIGLAEADAGQLVDGKAFFAELESEERAFERQ